MQETVPLKEQPYMEFSQIIQRNVFDKYLSNLQKTCINEITVMRKKNGRKIHQFKPGHVPHNKGVRTAHLPQEKPPTPNYVRLSTDMQDMIDTYVVRDPNSVTESSYGQNVVILRSRSSAPSVLDKQPAVRQVKKSNIARKSTTKTPSFDQRIKNGEFTSRAVKAVTESQKSNSSTTNGVKTELEIEKVNDNEERHSPLFEDLKNVPSLKPDKCDSNGHSDVLGQQADNSDKIQNSTRWCVNGNELKREETNLSGIKTEEEEEEYPSHVSPTPSSALHILESSLNNDKEKYLSSRNGNHASLIDGISGPSRNGSSGPSMDVSPTSFITNTTNPDIDCEKGGCDGNLLSTSDPNKNVHKCVMRRQTKLHREASSDCPLTEKSLHHSDSKECAFSTNGRCNLSINRQCESSINRQCDLSTEEQRSFADKHDKENISENLSDVSADGAHNSQDGEHVEMLQEDNPNRKERDWASAGTEEEGMEEDEEKAALLQDSEMPCVSERLSPSSISDDSEEVFIDESLLDDSSDLKEAQKTDSKMSGNSSPAGCDMKPDTTFHNGQPFSTEVTRRTGPETTHTDRMDSKTAIVKSEQTKPVENEVKGETATKIETEKATTLEADVEMKATEMEMAAEVKDTKSETMENHDESKSSETENDVEMKAINSGASEVITTKFEANDPVKTDVKAVEESPGNKMSVTSEQTSRKRSLTSTDSEDDKNQSVKKSRLDNSIGQLGSAVGKFLSEVIVADKVSQRSTCNNVGSTHSSKSETPSTVSCNEKNKKINKAVKVTEKDLEVLIAKRLTKLLEKRQDVMLAGFRKRIEELQASDEAWKAQVKKLKTQVQELTAQLQRSQRRRPSAARPIVRNMAVQVNEEKVKELMSKIASNQNNPAMAAGQKASVPGQPVVLSRAPSGVVVTAAGAGANQGRALQAGGVKYVASNNLRTIVQQAGQPAPLPGSVKTVNTSPTTGSSPSTGSGTSTVRALLDAQRVTTQRVVLRGSQILQSTSQTVPSANVVVPAKVMTKQAVIDLTDDDDPNNPQRNSKPLPLKAVSKTALSNPSQTLIRTAGLPIRPGTVLVPSSGGTVLLPAAGTRQVYVQQLVQNPRISAPGGPVTLAGTSAVRQTLMPVNTTPQPPQLRPGQVVTVRTSGNPLALNRQPPPLQSAPTPHSNLLRHPAPLPPQPTNQVTAASQGATKHLPPKPNLKISRVQQGIVLSWNMTVNSSYSEIANYQLFAYQESSTPPNTSLWKKVGDVKALPLPMACTLTQFQEGNKYHFAVRAMDIHGRVGPFSDPNSIHLVAQITVS